MERRRLIWERILTFYQPAIRPREASADDVVVALGVEAREAAELLAAVSGRTVYEIDRSTQLARCATFARTVCLVSVAERLDASTLATVQEMMRDVRWGVLTARDAAGLSFVAAKQLLGDPRADTVHILDLLHHSDAGSRQEQLVRLQREDAAAWIIAAHGEGAHANLHELVLCGAPREGEGSELGCRPCAEPPSCKRVHDPAVRVMSFADLRAAELIFLSCTGFSVAGQHYPSGVSAVLSALEGSVRTILTTDRAIKIWPNDAHRVAELRRAGVGLPALVELLNETWRHELAIAPYLLIGDPARCAAEAPLAAGALPKIVDIGTIQARRSATKIWASPSPREPEDASEALETAVALVDEWERRVARGRQWELAMQVVLGTEPQGLRQIRCATELVLARLDGVLGLVTRRGLWCPSIELLLAQLEELAALWSRTAADMAAGGWLTAADLLSGATSRHRSVSAGAPCDRCGAPTDRCTFDFAGGGSHTRLDCRVCGFRAAFSTEDRRILVTAPATLRPGAQTRFVVELAGGEGDGYLAHHLTDKGRGARLASGSAPAEGRAILDVMLPGNLTPDLHTLSVAWIQDFDIAIHRARIPGAP